MSLEYQQARLFLEPLEGKTTAFLLGDRPSNRILSRSILTLLSASRRACTILDLDAFYSSNLETISKHLSSTAMDNLQIIVPEVSVSIEQTLSGLLAVDPERPLIIDSANSLFHLLAWQNPKSSNRKFAFLIATLSAWARANRKPVLSSLYVREKVARVGTSRSLSDAFDIAVSTSKKRNGLALRCELGRAWRDGVFFLSL